MNFNTKGFSIITKFILLLCIGLFLVDAISSCKKNNDVVDDLVENVTLSFETNGGTTINPIEVKKGEKATPPTSPTKDGFVFKGWFADKEFTTPFNFDEAITMDRTIYAKWVARDPDAYIFTFETKGGSPINPIEVKKGEKATKPNNPTKNGFVFKGWFADEECTTAFSFDEVITMDRTIYAKWTALTTAFWDIIREKKIPNDIANYTDMLSKEVLSRYPVGAELVTIHLSPTGTGDGSSWSKAQGNLKTVLDGITDAYSNKIYLILLAKGEYKAGAAISMKNNVAIVGGFTAPKDEDYTQSTTETTTLSGDNSYRIFNNTGLDNSAILYGVKITAGNIANKGGGMRNDKSSPILTYVTFSGNNSEAGGGMSNENKSSPILTYVTFSGNIVATGNGAGGGMQNDNSSPILNYVTFTGNSARSYGGGMYNANSSSPILSHVTFTGNSAGGYGGGGMYNTNSSPILTYVTFSGNSVTDGAYGGGMSNEQSSPILSHVTFSGNNAGSGGGGGIYNGGSTILITSSILWGNTNGSGSTDNINNLNGKVSFYNSVLQGGKNGVTGTPYYDVSMVDTDPSLATLMNNGGFVQTMLIPSNSSAKDRGLYVKRSGNTVYFSNDNTSWFTIDASTGAKTTATPPTDAIDLSTADARGYKILDKPDAGAYEYGATAP